MPSLQPRDQPSKQEITRRHWLIIAMALAAAERTGVPQDNETGPRQAPANCTRFAEGVGGAGPSGGRLCQACSIQCEGVL